MTQAILAKMKCIEASLVETPEGKQVRVAFQSQNSHTENGYFSDEVVIYGCGFEVGKTYDFELKIVPKP